MRALAALALFLTAGCGDPGVRPCRVHTALVRFELSGAIASADRLDVRVTVEGMTEKSFPNLVRKSMAGAETLEVAFDAGYPTGKLMTVSVTALVGENPVGVGSGRTTLDGDCGSLRVILDAVEPPDLARPAMVSTLAGSSQGYKDGAGAQAQFSTPTAVSVDGAGVAYVADLSNNRIRAIAADGTTSTFAGGAAGDTDGPIAGALFRGLTEALVMGDGTIYVADPGNQKVKRIAANVVATLAGNGMMGNSNGTGGAGGTTTFRGPAGIAVDAAGNVYVADAKNNLVRKIAPDGSTTTLAGSGVAGFADGLGAAALFNHPADVAIDGAGNLYVADRDNSSIRKIAPDGTTVTLAGNGMPGFADGSGGVQGAARFNQPEGLAVDGAGSVYVADKSNHRIRRVAPDGTTRTYAGSGNPGFLDAPADVAMFSLPSGVFVDGAGVLYVADTGNQRIRRITPP